MFCVSFAANRNRGVSKFGRINECVTTDVSVAFLQAKRVSHDNGQIVSEMFVWPCLAFAAVMLSAQDPSTCRSLLYDL